MADDVNDTFSPGDQMTGQDDVPNDEGQEDSGKGPEDDESIEPDGRMTLNSQGLAD